MAGRYVGVPRARLAEIVSDQSRWRAFGERMKERAQQLCPVGTNEDREGPHLRDTLEAKFITGSDPRILIGSRQKGDVLYFLTKGTQDHFVKPVRAKALRFTSGGQVVFSAGHTVKGIQPNDFVMEAVRQVGREG